MENNRRFAIFSDLKTDRFLFHTLEISSLVLNGDVRMNYRPLILANSDIQDILEGTKREHRIPMSELKEPLCRGDRLLIGMKFQIEITDVRIEPHGEQLECVFGFKLLRE